MNRLASSQRPNFRCHENGLTLVELLVSLVVVGLLATAIFTFFLTTSQSVSQQSASGEMWQRGRNALAIMRQAIESAGYGLPSYSQCPNGVVGYSNTGNKPLTMTAITASIQSSGYTYESPYTFSTVIGGGSFGGAPATTVASLPNLNDANIKVNNSAPLESCDMALIVPTSSGGTCIFGEITTVGGSGSGNGNGNGGNGGNGTITMNAGGASCAKINTNQIFSQLSNSNNNISNSDFTNAPLYDLGNAGFVVNQFQILDTPPGSTQTGTPTLYLTQYTTNSGGTPTPQALASGVVDLQLQYGLGTNGTVQQWVTPGNYTPSATQNIVAVQLAMLIRSSRYLPNSLSPASYSIMGTTYTVPTIGGPGCLQGNCQHYEYHLFQSVIPVRNGIWQGD